MGGDGLSFYFRAWRWDALGRQEALFPGRIAGKIKACRFQPCVVPLPVKQVVHHISPVAVLPAFVRKEGFLPSVLIAQQQVGGKNRLAEKGHLPPCQFHMLMDKGPLVSAPAFSQDDSQAVGLPRTQQPGQIGNGVIAALGIIAVGGLQFSILRPPAVCRYLLVAQPTAEKNGGNKPFPHKKFFSEIRGLPFPVLSGGDEGSLPGAV